MKISIVILSSLLTIGCASNTKQPSTSSYKKKAYPAKVANKDNFKACINKAVIVDLFAKHRDAGQFVQATKEYLAFSKIKEGNSTVSRRIFRVVDKNPFLKPDVLSAAFAVQCYSPALRSPYEMTSMKAYVVCNKYSGNTQAIGNCVRRTAGVN